MSVGTDVGDDIGKSRQESIRLLLPDELGQYAEHLLRLDPLSRYMRFGGQMSDIALRRHAQRVASVAAGVIGYFDDGVLRGVAELHPFPIRGARPRSAEIALSVERDWQGHGVGSRLMDRIVAYARGHGIADIRLVFLAANGRMKRMAVGREATLAGDAGEIVASLSVRPPTPFSWMREAARSLVAVGDAAASVPRRLATGSASGR